MTFLLFNCNGFTSALYTICGNDRNKSYRNTVSGKVSQSFKEGFTRKKLSEKIILNKYPKPTTYNLIKLLKLTTKVARKLKQKFYSEIKLQTHFLQPRRKSLSNTLRSL